VKANARKTEFLAAMGFLLPNFIGFVIFMAGPVLFSLVMSFSNWNIQRTVPFEWNGFSNYADLLSDQQFWIYFINTIYFLLAMPVAIAGSLFLAILLNQKLKGIVVYRTLFFLPSFTAGVALLLLWKKLYNPDIGPINTVIDWGIVTTHINEGLHKIGLAGISPPGWLLSTKNVLALDVESVATNAKQWGLGARDAIIYMGVWAGIGGSNMLLYLAALSNMPQELIEAAQLDGAGRWAVFKHVIWPQLAPTTFFIVVMGFIGGLQGGFENAKILTGGGPAGTTTTLAYYIYSKAFTEFQLGYASAVSWVLFAMVFVVTMINWKIGSRDINY
jgi:multiple sugar transport system permease protein